MNLRHSYDKVLGQKTNNIFEPIYDTDSGLHIFDDKKISGKFHIEKIGKNEFDLQFRHEIEEEIDSVLELNQTSSSEIFFNITHIKQAIKNSNKSSARGPDCITIELVQNKGEQLFHCLPISCRQVIFLGTSQNLKKKENQIYLKKPGTKSYHLENSYRSISLSNILGKIYEKIILQQATNILKKNNFFEGKNLYAY